MSLKERPKLGVGCVVTTTDGDVRVLLGVRKGAHGAGTLSFPGGKPDGGESPQEAAIRELREETNLAASEAVPLDLWTYDRFEEDDLHYVTLYFAMVVEDLSTLETTEPEKCEGWKWYDPHAHPLDEFALPRDATFFAGVDEVLGRLV